MNKIEKIDCIKVNDDKSVYVRKSIEHYADGALTGHEFSQEVINPGDDFLQQDDAVKAVCSQEHTQEAVETFARSIESQRLQGEF